MRAVLYAMILALVLIAPVKKEDIGDLEPIQAIWLFSKGNEIALKTDTGDYGTGTSVHDAIRVMKENSEGVVYLDTAQFLLVSENALPRISEIKQYLKGSVKLCIWEGDDVCLAARYMQAHDAGCKIREFNSTTQLPTIPKITKESGESQQNSVLP